MFHKKMGCITWGVEDNRKSLLQESLKIVHKYHSLDFLLRSSGIATFIKTSISFFFFLLQMLIITDLEPYSYTGRILTRERPTRWLERWSMSPARKSWENLVCSAQERGGDLNEAFQFLKGAHKKEEGLLQRWQEKGKWLHTERGWI